jgi:hypothetical protein
MDAEAQGRASGVAECGKKNMQENTILFEKEIES